MNNFIDILEYSNSPTATINLYSKLLQNNIIFINGEFTTQNVSDWQAQLLYLKNILKPGDTIQLYINSDGGEVYNFLGLYDLIQYTIKSKINVATINIAKAMSAAGYILLSGSPGLRQSLSNATTMLHQPFGSVNGTISDLQIEINESQRLKTAMQNIIKKHASEQLIPLLERNIYLSGNDALSYNVIDKIL